MIFKIHCILLFSIFCLSCMEERDYFTTKEKKQLKDIIRKELENQEDPLSEIDLRRNLQKHIEPLSASLSQSSSGLRLNCKCTTMPMEHEALADTGEEPQAASEEETAAEEAAADENTSPEDQDTEEQASQEETSLTQEEPDIVEWVQGIGFTEELAKEDAVRKCSELSAQWNDAACESVSLSTQ